MHCSFNPHNTAADVLTHRAPLSTANYPADNLYPRRRVAKAVVFLDGLWSVDGQKEAGPL